MGREVTPKACKCPPDNLQRAQFSSPHLRHGLSIQQVEVVNWTIRNRAADGTMSKRHQHISLTAASWTRSL